MAFVAPFILQVDAGLPIESDQVRLEPVTSPEGRTRTVMIRKLKSGKYRLYSRKLNPRTGKRRNLGTFETREAAEKHERAVQYFKRKG